MLEFSSPEKAPTLESPPEKTPHFLALWLPRLLVLLGASSLLWLLQALATGRLASAFALDNYVQDIIVYAGINVLLAISLNLISGVTGQFSLGHAGFMAVGAYATAAFTQFAGPRLALPNDLIFLLALLCGALTAGIAGLLVGLPSLRLRGDYLAIVTLGFGQIIVNLIQNLDIIGGSNGLNGLNKWTTLLWVYGAVFLCALTLRNLFQSNIGRAMRAIRDDEIAAAASGINTTRVKVTAFVISAMWAGVAGGLYVHYKQQAHPNDFLFLRSVEIVVAVVLGGLGSMTGAAIAAAALKILEEMLRDVRWSFYALLALVLLATALSYPKYKNEIKAGGAGLVRWLFWPILSLAALLWLFNTQGEWLQNKDSALRYIIYALILMVMMLLRPQGLMGRAELGRHWFRRRR